MINKEGKRDDQPKGDDGGLVHAAAHVQPGTKEMVEPVGVISEEEGEKKSGTFKRFEQHVANPTTRNFTVVGAKRGMEFEEEGEMTNMKSKITCDVVMGEVEYPESVEESAENSMAGLLKQLSKAQ
jgi:hypothetical protein